MNKPQHLFGSLFESITALRWLVVWRRHALVWRKLAGPALLGNIGEPLLYLFALGYGLGMLVGQVEGLDYMTFLASGVLCASVMNTASFEAIYSAFTRMTVQDTWRSMLYTPLNLADVMLGEVAWAASKSLLSATAILLVAWLMGAVHSLNALWVLPIALLAGFSFAAMAIIMTALSRSYDFFLYYFTLLLTPMMLLSGVFFPLEQMPQVVQGIALALPLSHLVELVRPLMTGQSLQDVWLHLTVLVGYGLLALQVAAYLLYRRFYQ